MVAGAENKIEVITYKAEGYLAGRSTGLVYIAPFEEKIEPPNLFALLVGVSNYRDVGSLRDVTFAAKDTEAMATVLRAAAIDSFPVGPTSHCFLPPAIIQRSNPRPNIVNALKEIASKAESPDILLLYFAGHGVSFGGQDGDLAYKTCYAPWLDEFLHELSIWIKRLAEGAVDKGKVTHAPITKISR